MKSIEILENSIQEYHWGSHTAISELLGEKTPSCNPQAELWMGAHPKASSLLNINGEKISLRELIKNYPEEILGRRSVHQFGKQLPFLFKVLAAEKPLSLQVHPNAKQAQEGFVGENKKSIALDSPKRNYRDKNHKPECICALTDFWVLNGFRSVSTIVSFMEQLSGGMLENEIKHLKQNRNAKGLRCFIEVLMTLRSEKKEALIKTILLKVNKNVNKDPSSGWIIDLHREYGIDIGVLSPLLLNLICLKPGEAMFLESGELHSYLRGVGIELMANSDNVIRGGLTKKHVDIPELFRIVNFEEKKITILLPKKIETGEMAYPCNADEFILSMLDVGTNANYTRLKEDSVEIMICVNGNAAIYDVANGKTILLEKGTSVIVPAAVNEYYITGEAKLYKAAVPI